MAIKVTEGREVRGVRKAAQTAFFKVSLSSLPTCLFWLLFSSFQTLLKTHFVGRLTRSALLFHPHSASH